MEFNSNDDDIEMWDWQEGDFSLQKNSEIDVPHCLWNDTSRIDNGFLYTWGDHTPSKDVGNYGYNLHVGDKTDKGPEESIGSQSKRRRMLQFIPEDNDTFIGNEQTPFVSESSKELENSLLADEMLECLEWDHEWHSSLQGLDQPSEGWLANCLTNTEMNLSCGETSLRMNDSALSDDQIVSQESIKTPSETEDAMGKGKSRASICRILRGKKSIMNTPTKLTTTVAYPFTLVKPCKDQGDVTLKDINQRIHGPLLSKSKNKKNEDPSPYPTSAFSGKPVVIKTRIRTVGGKGSITIMRTKG